MDHRIGRLKDGYAWLECGKNKIVRDCSQCSTASRATHKRHDCCKGKRDFDIARRESKSRSYLHVLRSHHCSQEASERIRILPVDRHFLRELLLEAMIICKEIEVV